MGNKGIKMSYEIFSQYYDIFLANADYKKRTEYALKLFKKYDRKPTLLLDLACGTGGFTVEFAKRNIETIGVDVSPEMLMKARENLAQNSAEALLLCQSAENLDLYGTVDGAVCFLDSLNHITDYDELCRSLKKVSLFLEPERLFIFDVNTVYKHKEVLSKQNFVFEDEATDTVCVWRNSECDKNGVVEISLDFFVGNTDGEYKRYSEQFCERAYNTEQIEKALKIAGLEIVEILSENTLNKADEKTERAIYVTRKI